MRPRLRDDPDRLELHLWLKRNKRLTLRELGRRRPERSEEPLLEAVADWVRDNAPALVGRVPDWQDDLPGFLRSTGLLVSEEDGFRFLHHSFVEYFAAEAYAAEIPSDFPDPNRGFGAPPTAATRRSRCSCCACGQTGHAAGRPPAGRGRPVR